MHPDQPVASIDIKPIVINGDKADQLIGLGKLVGQFSDLYFGFSISVIFIALLADQDQSDFMFIATKGLCIVTLVLFFVKNAVVKKKDVVLKLAIDEAKSKG
jgi:predicted branched-subunit amino acid permease